jgi:hypothetical protein
MWMSSPAPSPMMCTPKELVRVPVEDQLQEAAAVADDLAARDLLVVGLAHLVGDAVARELLPVAAHRGDLGDRVDLLPEPERHAVSAQMERERVQDLRFDVGQ